MASRVRKLPLLALVAAAALPATAAADEQVAAPKADAYLQPVFLNNGNGLVAGDQLSFGADTTSYTTQKSLYDPQFDANGNPVHGPAGAGGAPPLRATGYRKTIWGPLPPKPHRVGENNANTESLDAGLRRVAVAQPQS